MAVSARRAGDRHLEVYYVESTDGGASWSAPMRMLHAADDCARTSVNVVQDAGSVWVGALRGCGGAAATGAAVWYRERGDRFTAETDVAGVARQLVARAAHAGVYARVVAGTVAALLIGLGAVAAVVVARSAFAGLAAALHGEAQNENDDDEKDGKKRKAE